MNDFLDDLEDDFGDAAVVAEAPTYVEQCRKCAGTGRVAFGWVVQRTGECFACKGAGSFTRKTSPEARAKAKASRVKREADSAQQKRDAVQAFADAHPAEYKWLTTNSSDFAQSLLNALNKFGHLTEKQLACVSSSIARQAEWKQQREASAKAVSIEAIEQAFANAKEAGSKRPVLRLDTFMFSPAKETSVNAGAVYVKQDGVYLGKVMGGKLFATRECDAQTQDRIVAVASNPKQAAIEYGRNTGCCSVCNRELTDQNSIEAGIGPICADKYGF